MLTDNRATVAVQKAYLSAALDVQRLKRVKEQMEIELLRRQLEKPTGQQVHQQGSSG